MFDVAFPRGGFGFWRTPRETEQTAEQIRQRRDLVEEGRRIEEAFFLPARELFPQEAGTEALALALLEQWADIYETDYAHREIVDRMERLVQRPSIRRSGELKESTRLRMDMWRAAREYVGWRKRWVAQVNEAAER